MRRSSLRAFWASETLRAHSRSSETCMLQESRIPLKCSRRPALLFLATRSPVRPVQAWTARLMSALLGSSPSRPDSMARVINSSLLSWYIFFSARKFVSPSRVSVRAWFNSIIWSGRRSSSPTTSTPGLDAMPSSCGVKGTSDMLPSEVRSSNRAAWKKERAISNSSPPPPHAAASSPPDRTTAISTSDLLTMERDIPASLLLRPASATNADTGPSRRQRPIRHSPRRHPRVYRPLSRRASPRRRHDHRH